MDYISTRGQDGPLGFEQALLSGLARDGGLYLPVEWPRFSKAEIAAMKGLSYAELAGRIMAPFCDGEISEAELTAMAGDAYAGFDDPAIAPLVKLNDDIHILELFHGPTIAFKDYAMQFLARAFDRALAKKQQHAVILGATSGDTGSAALEAFQGRDAVDVFILFPDGRVSPVQQRQMTSVIADGAFAVSVKGDFDDCQALVKTLFNDHQFRDQVGLSAVNSINWARLMPQIVYYFSSALALGAPDQKVAFSVPTGNFGNVFAGYAAVQMGLPVERLIVASNQNDILPRFFEAGTMARETVVPSLSPSMDIQVSSNFERALYFAYGKDGAAVAGLMEELKAGGFTLSQGVKAALAGAFDSGRCSEAETSATITATLKNAAELLCPHTAVGVKVAEEQRVQGVPMITLATAHPAKFPDAVEAASGIRPGLPPHMADLFERPERVTRLSNDLSALEAHVREHRRK